MRLLSCLEYERSFGASWGSYFLRIPKRSRLQYLSASRLAQKHWNLNDFTIKPCNNFNEHKIIRVIEATITTLILCDQPVTIAGPRFPVVSLCQLKRLTSHRMSG